MSSINELIEQTREKFTNIANAIRSVNGEIREYTVDEMPSAIEELSNGGDSIVDENGIQSTKITSLKIIDMALNKTGVVSNQATLQSISNKILTVLQDTAIAFINYCNDNNLELNEINKSSFLISDSYVDSTIALWAWNSQTFFNLISNSDFSNLKDSDLCLLLVNHTVCSRGENYIIDDEEVELIRSAFNEYTEEKSSYYYINTFGTEDLNPLWFQSEEQYQWLKDIITNMDDVMYLIITSTISDRLMTFGSDNKAVISNYRIHYLPTKFGLIQKTGVPSECLYAYDIYSDIWATYQSRYSEFSNNQFQQYTLDEITNTTTTSNLSEIRSTIGYKTSSQWIGYVGLYTNDGRPIKVYKTLEDFKADSLGKSSYYTIATSQDSNSVLFTGDYYNDFRNTYTYDTIQTIFNNTSDITENIINTIVSDQLNIESQKWKKDIDNILLLQDKTITSNGEYTADEGYDGLGKVTVDIGVRDGFNANFYSENGELIQTLSATNGMEIRPPDYDCTCWFDETGALVTFPYELTKATNFYAQQNPTYADSIYQYYGVSKVTYPYLLVQWSDNFDSKVLFFKSWSKKSIYYELNEVIRYIEISRHSNLTDFSDLTQITQLIMAIRDDSNVSTEQQVSIDIGFTGNNNQKCYYYSNFDTGYNNATRYFRLDTVMEVIVKDPYALQSKTVTSNGTVKPDDGYYGLSEVVVDVSTIGEPIIESHSEVESIITDGTSYINTYICPNPNYSIEMEFKMAQIVEDNWDFLFGCKFGDKSGIAARFDTGVGGTLAVKRSPTYLTVREWGITNLTRNDFATHRIFKLVKNKAYVDDTLIYTFQTTAEANEQHYAYPLYLFTVNDSNTTYLNNSGYLDVKYVKLWDEKDNLILDLIPVVKNDGTICMYNKVNNAYYYNAGTGTFTYSTEEDSSSITIEE